MSMQMHVCVVLRRVLMAVITVMLQEPRTNATKNYVVIMMMLKHSVIILVLEME
jgi:hypothetical protein